jgi:hypothetical protein
MGKYYKLSTAVVQMGVVGLMSLSLLLGLGLGMQEVQEDDDKLSTAAACDITALEPCIDAAKQAMTPSVACCSSIASLGSGPTGVSCLCSLVISQTAKEFGVQFPVAIGIPQRCGLAVPPGAQCDGTIYYMSR